VSSKRSRSKRKERVQKDGQCSANRGGEREKKKGNEKIKKLEIVFLTQGTHRAHPPGYILYNLYGTI
jgi:hypothetical protein